jgi:AraC-like DNA-binding protein
MVSQLVIYLNDGINHPTLNEIKEKELFLILFSYYSNSELLTLFYPLLGSNISFKSFVMQNYNRVSSVQQFADLANCSLSTFKRRFHENFGVSVYQWMLDQKSKHILHALTLENISFADIIFEYGFSSASHFCSFCKHKFGASPKALREQLRQELGCCVG